MKKHLLIVLALIAMVLSFSSCAHEHAWSEWTTTKEATCTADGEQTRTCECGETEKQVIPAKGHTPGAEANCTEAQTCTVCNAELTAAKGHALGAEADCTTAQTCTVCNAELTAAKGHTPGAAATCTEAQKCTVCNVELTAAKGHAFGEWVIIIPATKTENGLKEQTCLGCGAIIRETVPSIVSEGLQFTQNSDGTYSVSGIGTCTDTEVVIPGIHEGKAVTSIGRYAFRNCKNLTSIVIPEGVTSIGSYAFRGCGSLTSIAIPESVTSIGDSAFDDCVGLKEISVNKNNAKYYSEDGVLFNKAKTELIYYPMGKTETTYTIPSGVTSIGRYSFRNCNNLTEIVISDSVTSIGTAAFFGCALKRIVLPANVTGISASTFDGCDALTEIFVNENNPSYCSENGILFNKSKTELIYYPAGKTEDSYSVPFGVMTVGSYAFLSCGSLTNIVMPESVTSIGLGAFYGCENLTSIVIPSGVTKIDSYAFYHCSSLTDIVIPSGVTEIGSYAFYGCSALTSIMIPSGVTGIWECTFYGCSALTSIVIPESVSDIGASAFRNCSSLTDITLPEKEIFNIGPYAFAGCSKLTSVVIPLMSYTNPSEFADCVSLTTITFRGTIAQWQAISFSSDWNKNTGNYTVICTDGAIAKNGTVTYN